jgi:hypothetical protein
VNFAGWISAKNAVCKTVSHSPSTVKRGAYSTHNADHEYIGLTAPERDHETDPARPFEKQPHALRNSDQK